MRQGILNSLSFPWNSSMKGNTYSNINERLLSPIDIVIQPGKQTVIHIKPQVSTENEVTGITQSYPDLKSNDALIICPALATTHNSKYSVLISDFLAHP